MPRQDSRIPFGELQEMVRAERARIVALNDTHRRYTRSYYGYGGETYTNPARYEEGEEFSQPFATTFNRPAMADPLYTNQPCTYCGDGSGCTRCRPDLYGTCECGSTYLYVSGCHCWMYCPLCDAHGAFTRTRVIAEIPDGYGGEDRNHVCSPECAEEHGYQECHDCTTYVHSGREDRLCRRHRPCGCGRCSRCQERANIHSYSYRPDLLFKGTGPVYLGMENEIDVTGARSSLVDIAEYVNGRMRNGEIGYLKSDSSISHGFELVTHPMSYPWAITEFPWDMYEQLTGEFGVEEDDNCGIHVHVSRDGFDNPAHVYRWMKFFYRNALPIQAVARRYGSSWARFSAEARGNAALYAKKQLGDPVPMDAWYLKGDARRRVRQYADTYGYDQIDCPSQDRYSAINIQNGETFEVRVFAGSVDATEIRAALGLVHGTVEYTRTLDTSSILKKGGWNWDVFASWAADRPEYESLTDQIQKLVTD